LEIGTSAGYSTLWFALACRETNNNEINLNFYMPKRLKVILVQLF